MTWDFPNQRPEKRVKSLVFNNIVNFKTLSLALMLPRFSKLERTFTVNLKFYHPMKKETPAKLIATISFQLRQSLPYSQTSAAFQLYYFKLTLKSMLSFPTIQNGQHIIQTNIDHILNSKVRVEADMWCQNYIWHL